MTEKAYDAVTLARAAAFLGLSRRQVQRLIAAGKITVFRYSKRSVRIDFASLKAYRASATVDDQTRQ